MTFDYDLFVIGGGSGGVRAARIAASEYGARVGLAEEDRMGGTCVIRGCVPKKLMIFASQAGAMAAESRGYGWSDAGAGQFDWPAFHAKLADDRQRGRTQHLVFVVGKCLRRGDDDAVAGMYADRIDVFHIADHDAVVG